MTPAQDLVRRLLDAAVCPRCGPVRDWHSNEGEDPVWAEAEAFLGGDTAGPQ